MRKNQIWCLESAWFSASNPLLKMPIEKFDLVHAEAAEPEPIFTSTEAWMHQTFVSFATRNYGRKPQNSVPTLSSVPLVLGIGWILKVLFTLRNYLGNLFKSIVCVNIR